MEPYLSWPLCYKAYADAQLSVRILFYVDTIFFLCYIAVFNATFYVGLVIHTHICQPRAVWQAALTLSVNEMTISENVMLFS